MFKTPSLLPFPQDWSKRLSILVLGTSGKRYDFDFESFPLSSVLEVVLTLVVYLSFLALLKVRNLKIDFRHPSRVHNPL